MAESYYNPERFVLLVDAKPGLLSALPPRPSEWIGVPRRIHCPIAVVLGHFERLTPEELEDLRADIAEEITRRNADRVSFTFDPPEDNPE